MGANRPTFCRVCEPSCALIAEVENDKVVGLKPDREHPVTKGFACHKGIGFVDVHHDPDRLDCPLQKTVDGFQQCSWDDAVSDIAGQLKRIIDRYGADAVAGYTGNPTAFNARTSA